MTAATVYAILINATNITDIGFVARFISAKILVGVCAQALSLMTTKEKSRLAEWHAVSKCDKKKALNLNTFFDRGK